jgi:hypothetical protein
VKTATLTIGVVSIVSIKSGAGTLNVAEEMPQFPADAVYWGQRSWHMYG